MINDSAFVRQQLEQALQASGFKLISLDDLGRSYLGQAAKDGTSYHVKVAKSKAENLRLQNGAVFNRAVFKLKPPFSVPEVVLTGTLLDDFYFKVETSLVGTPFAILKAGISELQIDDPASYFPAINGMISWLQRQKITLPSGFDQQLHAFFAKNNQTAIDTMISWSYNSTPRFSDLLKIVQANESALEQVTVHRDLTPINIIVTGPGRVGLIDADLAETTGPQYYDVAEFYNRLWTRMCRPDLAKRFLAEVVSHLPQDKSHFYHSLLAILAVRSVGNYFEIMQLGDNQAKRIEFAKSFASHVADKEFLN